MSVARVRVFAVLAMLAAVVVVAVAARSTSTHPFTATATAGQHAVRTVIPRSEPVVTQTLGGGNEAPESKHHQGTAWARAALLALLVLALAGFIWRIARSDWSPWRRTTVPKHAMPVPEPTETAPERLRAAVDASLESLERGPVTDAIIACWVRVEAAAAAVGIAVQPSETSSEFVDRVLASYGAREAALRRLSALYREARFSSHELGEPSREEARACLADIRTDLASVRAAL